MHMVWVLLIDGVMHEAQFGYCSFVPRRKNARLGIDKVDFSGWQFSPWRRGFVGIRVVCSGDGGHIPPTGLAGRGPVKLTGRGAILPHGDPCGGP